MSQILHGDILILNVLTIKSIHCLSEIPIIWVSQILSDSQCVFLTRALVVGMLVVWRPQLEPQVQTRMSAESWEVPAFN